MYSYIDTFVNKLYKLIMRLRDASKKTVSISEVRKDIDVLMDSLKSEGKVYVTKNNEVMFVVTGPEEYEREDKDRRARVLRDLAIFRQTHPSKIKKTSGEVIAEMREAMRREADEWNEE